MQGREGCSPGSLRGRTHRGAGCDTLQLLSSSSAALEEGFDLQAIPNLLKAGGGTSQEKQKAQRDGTSELGTGDGEVP